MSTLVVQAEAADATAFAKLELLCIKANHAHKLVEACGVPTIVRGLGQEQPGAVRRAAAGCLQNLAIDELIVSRYAQPHTSATRSLIQTTTRTVGSLIAHLSAAARSAAALTASNAVSQLVACVLSGDDEALAERAAGALANLTQNVRHAEAMVASSAVPSLLATLESASLGPTRTACAAAGSGGRVKRLPTRPWPPRLHSGWERRTRGRRRPARPAGAACDLGLRTTSGPPAR